MPVLIRPDGTEITVRDDDIPALTSLGYRPREATEARASELEARAHDYYTTPGQKVKTVIQGGLSGATFGLSDLAFSGDIDTQERARHNPGLRLGSELLGGFVAPVGPIGDLAAEGAGALHMGTTATRVVRGAAEGAAFGAGASITQATLNGDPLTAESIVAGAGWGSLFGGGLSGVLGKSADMLDNIGAKSDHLTGIPGATKSDRIIEGAARGEAERATAAAKMEQAVSESVADREKVVEGLGERHYGNFRAQIEDAASQADLAVKDASTMVADSAVPNFSDLRASDTALYNWLANSGNLDAVRGTQREMEKTLRMAKKAGYDGNYARMAEHLETYKAKAAEMADMFGPKFPAPLNPEAHVDELLTFAKTRFETAAGAADNLGQLTAIAGELRGLPTSTKGFMGMTEAKVEKISAAMDALDKLKAAEFSGVKSAIADSLDKYAERLGVTIPAEGGTLGSTFRTLQETVSDIGRRKILDEAGRIARGEKAWAAADEAETELGRAQRPLSKDALKAHKSPGIGHSGIAMAGGLIAEEMAGKHGVHGFGRYGAYLVGKHATAALLGIKGGVLGAVSESVAKWAPAGARALRSIPAARVSPLIRRISGEMDTQNKTRTEMMRARAAEIRSAAPVVRDVLYRNISPLGAEHPELSAAMHELAANQFKFIFNKLPTDPGGAFNQLHTLWSPSEAEVLKFERYYAVFQDPVKEIQSAMASGHISPELTEGLREMYPQLYAEMKADLLIRISDPTVWSKMSYPEQVNMGMLLGFPVHSTMRPKFIAAQMKMYQERGNTIPLRPQPAAQSMGGGGGGRPPGPGDGSTQAQRTTEH